MKERWDQDPDLDPEPENAWTTLLSVAAYPRGNVHGD